MLDGSLHPDYADVAATLIRQIPKQRRGGGAVCVYHRGRCVVDVWGGDKDSAGNPWRSDTTAASFSTSKGVMSTLVHILVDQGRASYDDPIAKYWPEFGVRGKDAVTIRHALCHEAGIYRVTELIKQPAEMLDWTHMLGLIADAELAHRPGERHGYHALTFGWLIGGLIEAIAGEPLQTVLAKVLVDPLDLDGMFIGMPHDQLSRRAELIDTGVSKPPKQRDGWREALGDFSEVALERVGVELGEFRAALMPFSETFDWNDEAVVQAQIPAANGQFTARSLARMYAMMAEGGKLDGVRLLSEERVREIGYVRSRSRDKVLFIPMHWRMGFHRVFTIGVRVPNAFGHYGFGGSGAFCDPSRRLAVAFTANSGAGSPMADGRMAKIASAALRTADRLGADA